MSVGELLYLRRFCAGVRASLNVMPALGESYGDPAKNIYAASKIPDHSSGAAALRVDREAAR